MGHGIRGLALDRERISRVCCQEIREQKKLRKKKGIAGKMEDLKITFNTQ
jgi:hypothetical protein